MGSFLWVIFCKDSVLGKTKQVFCCKNNVFLLKFVILINASNTYVKYLSDRNTIIVIEYLRRSYSRLSGGFLKVKHWHV